jgi:hypothetical protein
VAEKRADQRFPSIIVQAVACPEGGDVRRIGEGVGGGLAAVVSGQSVVASLGMKDVGQVTDVVLPAAVAAPGEPEPDVMVRAQRDLGEFPGDGEDERVAAGAQRQQIVRRTCPGIGGSASGAVSGRSSGSA